MNVIDIAIDVSVKATFGTKHFLLINLFCMNAVKNLQKTKSNELSKTIMQGAWKCIAALQLLHMKNIDIYLPICLKNLEIFHL